MYAITTATPCNWRDSSGYILQCNYYNGSPVFLSSLTWSGHKDGWAPERQLRSCLHTYDGNTIYGARDFSVFDDGCVDMWMSISNSVSTVICLCASYLVMHNFRRDIRVPPYGAGLFYYTKSSTPEFSELVYCSPPGIHGTWVLSATEPFPCRLRGGMTRRVHVQSPLEAAKSTQIRLSRGFHGEAIHIRRKSI
jgi:hypothetical protein